MSLLALEMPDDLGERCRWLEKQLVGTQLRELVRQLEVFQRPKAESEATRPLGRDWEERLRNLYGEQLASVMQNGLRTCSSDQVQLLLRHPRLLLALQELVFIEGGPYWQLVPRAATPATDRKPSEPFVERGPESAQIRTRTDSAWSRRITIALLSLAATILVGFFLRSSFQTQGRFFDRPGLLASGLQDQEFLKSLAGAIRDDWQNEDADAQAFRSKLVALRDSCDVMLAAPLGQLQPAVATELKTRCGKWRTAFTAQITSLDAGTPVTDVKRDANATVEKLVQALASGLS